MPGAADHSYGALTASIVPVVFALLRLVGVTGSGLLGWRHLDTALGLVIAVVVGHDWLVRRRRGALT